MKNRVIALIMNIFLLISFYWAGICFADDPMKIAEEDLDTIKHEQDLKALQHNKNLKERRVLENDIKATHETLVDLNKDRNQELHACHFVDLAKEKQCEESVMRKYEVLFSRHEVHLRELEEAYSKIKTGE